MSDHASEPPRLRRDNDFLVTGVLLAAFVPAGAVAAALLVLRTFFRNWQTSDGTLPLPYDWPPVVTYWGFTAALLLAAVVTACFRLRIAPAAMVVALVILLVLGSVNYGYGHRHDEERRPHPLPSNHQPCYSGSGSGSGKCN
ncbi:DUF6234 family protein [Kitasatospora sp. GP82]|uniref:DUF6234 family protein n=1 Tax=Kitasatospora sp. GP82 TaxID=3035089 RepID=UPI002475AC84|nr:DUF6234 family protein [Kitasatospora sp. GP82]MDH6124240.1 hypothetical protein [Kitasatospora sp. GP82]